MKKRQLVTQFATRLDLDKKLTALFGQGEEGKAKLVDFEDYLSDLGDRFSCLLYTSVPTCGLFLCCFRPQMDRVKSLFEHDLDPLKG